MYKKMTREEVIEFVEAARKAGDVADLTGANLSGLDLYCVNMSGASLRRAILRRVNLSGAILTDAILTKACLYGANLTKANLFGVDMYGADLRWVTLSGASLRRADLSGVNLSWATGIICLDITDRRGYRPVAVWHEDHWMIAAGCHWFTVEDAMAHWGPGYTGSRELGDRYLKGLEILKTMRGE